jgi:hypothetical protein
MLKLFSVGLIANLVYVITGALKQYFIAAQLVVSDVGVYGAWVAQASLLVVLVPLPAYLELLIRGFSAPPEAYPLRGSLVSGVLREFRQIAGVASVLLVLLLGASLMGFGGTSTVLALLVLLAAQYLGQIGDISLRMYQAHQRYAMFLALRNLPSLALIIGLDLDSPLAIVAVELLSALVVGLLAFRTRPLVNRDRSLPAPAITLAVRGERATLWLARLVQYVNASFLKLVVPFIFSAHDTGLFFFACVAQIPASLFLSVTTQLFGHALARIQPGEYRAILRIQAYFVAPNLLYIVGIACVVPYWPQLMTLVPGLAPYAGVGALVFAVALYSSILSSDCTEYLLRSRGLSRILLQYNLSSILGQIVVLGSSAILRLPIEITIILCAVMASMVLIAFSTYSFRLVLGSRAPAQSG